MTVLASTSCLRGPEDLLARVGRMRTAGIDAIELSQSIAPPGPVETWIGSLLSTGTRFLVHNYFPPPAAPFVLNLASPDELLRKRSIELARLAIDVSAGLGAPFYSVHAGFVLDPYAFGTTHFLFGPVDGASARVLATERFAESVAFVLEHAAAQGIELLVENNNTPPEFAQAVLLRDAAEIVAFLGRFDGRVGLLLDTGHLHVAATTLGFDAARAVRALRPYVRAIHLHDNDGSADYHRKAERGGWAMSVLADLQPLPSSIIVEGHCEDVAELAQHVRSLATELGSDGNR